jgi:hypothetical protein
MAASSAASPQSGGEDSKTRISSGFLTNLGAVGCLRESLLWGGGMILACSSILSLMHGNE